MAGINILPVGNRGAIFVPQVAILDFDRQIDTPERGRMVRDANGDGYATVLKNHGVAVCADSENACIATFALEETAHLQWIAVRLGTVQKISTGEVRSVLTGARKEEFFSHVGGAIREWIPGIVQPTATSALD
jgi:ribulose-5-phosphate 4-epimerase/fuculose-1-phosphate aldolase